MIALLLAALALADAPPADAVPATPPPTSDVGRVPRQLVALTAAGGYDLATRQPFAGLEVALHHDGAAGFAFVGRAHLGWGFLDMRPLARVEAGFAGVVKAKQIVRVGLVAGTGLLAAPYPAPLQVPGPPGEGDYAALSFLPYGVLTAELGGLHPGVPKGWAAWAVGLRLGAGVAIQAADACGDVELGVCGVAHATFVGGLTGRVRFHESAYLELLAGPTSQLSVGYAF